MERVLLLFELSFDADVVFHMPILLKDTRYVLSLVGGPINRFYI